MDAQQQITDAELLHAAAGMCYDTATLLDDVARRMPLLRKVRARAIAAELRAFADEAMSSDAQASPSTSADRGKASEASAPSALQPKPEA